MRLLARRQTMVLAVMIMAICVRFAEALFTMEHFETCEDISYLGNIRRFAKKLKEQNIC